MKKKTTVESNPQLDLNFKDRSSPIQKDQVNIQNLGTKVVKLDPNKEFYKRILNRKSY